jgi:STE24 endopeptidase
MKSLVLIAAALLLGMCLGPGRALAQAPPGPIPPPSNPTTDQASAPTPAQPEVSGRIVTEYTLPPDLYRKAKNLSRIRLAGAVIVPLYGFVVLWLVLQWKLAPLYRNWAEASSARRFLQVLIFAPLFTLTVDILELPIGIFQNWIARKYNLSVQGWPSWAWDWTKGEFISVILATILTFILYAVIRRSPRRWWFYFWLISLPLLVFLIFLQPLVIDPMFHKFEPLTQKDAPLVTSLEQMVQRAGEDIPPERMFWMGAAEKSNELNAYVTGLGSSKRIVVWDTTIAKLNTPQIVFVAGHETGHYVLNHIPKELAISVVGLFVLLYLGYRSTGWLLARRGARWDIRGMDDWASLPALLLLLGLFSFVVTPLSNAISRHFEHQADQYGLEVTHGLTPDSGQVAAQAFQVLGEISLDDPTPSPWDIILTYNHPSIRDRVRFCLNYDPWASGGHGEFVP